MSSVPFPSDMYHSVWEPPPSFWAIHPSSGGRVQPGQFASSSQGYYNKHLHSRSISSSQFTCIHIFGMREELRGPRENPHRCGEGIQKPFGTKCCHLLLLPSWWKSAAVFISLAASMLPCSPGRESLTLRFECSTSTWKAGYTQCLLL